jgi:hypothetical protein
MILRISISLFYIILFTGMGTAISRQNPFLFFLFAVEVLKEVSYFHADHKKLS